MRRAPVWAVPAATAAAVWLLLGCTPPVGVPRVEPPLTHRAPGNATQTGPVTVAWWNIEWFPAGPKTDPSPAAVSNHLAAVVAFIDAQNPTILLACEVRDFAAALMLNAALRRPYPFVAVTDSYNDNRSPESGRSRQELAIFSRIPWREVWEIDFGSLPAAVDKPARGLIGAVFDLGERPLTVYGGHWKSNYIQRGDSQPKLTALRNVEKRERASRLLLDDIRRRRGLDPMKDQIILCGDFNTDLWAERFQGDKTITMLLQAGLWNSLQDLPAEARVTITSRNRQWPPSTFDYILTSVGLGQRRAEVVWATKSDGEPGMPRHASDHAMVMVQLSGNP